MKKVLCVFVMAIVVIGCRVKEFSVNENNRVYSSAPIGTVIIDSTMRIGYIVKIIVIGKRGQYSYELIDQQGKTVKSGKYEKTHIVRGKGQKENVNGPPIKYRTRYYEPDTTGSK